MKINAKSVGAACLDNVSYTVLYNKDVVAAIRLKAHTTVFIYGISFSFPSINGYNHPVA